MNEIELIQNKIYEIRGQRVMLDRDLAELYGVETKVLNQAELLLMDFSYLRKKNVEVDHYKRKEYGKENYS